MGIMNGILNMLPLEDFIDDGLFMDVVRHKTPGLADADIRETARIMTDNVHDQFGLASDQRRHAKEQTDFQRISLHTTFAKAVDSRAAH